MKKLLLLAALLALLPLANSHAQPFGTETATFTLSANVLGQLSVVTDVNLDFGNVFQTTTQHVSVSGVPTYTAGASPTAAKFTISGAGNRPVTVSFTGHTTLTGTGDPMSVTYVANDAEFVSGTGAPTGSSGWNPTSAAFVGNLSTGDATVYLGGQVGPTVNMSGAYSGTGTITVAYTGN